MGRINDRIVGYILYSERAEMTLKMFGAGLRRRPSSANVQHSSLDITFELHDRERTFIKRNFMKR